MYYNTPLRQKLSALFENATQFMQSKTILKRYLPHRNQHQVYNEAFEMLAKYLANESKVRTDPISVEEARIDLAKKIKTEHSKDESSRLEGGDKVRPITSVLMKFINEEGMENTPEAVALNEHIINPVGYSEDKSGPHESRP